MSLPRRLADPERDGTWFVRDLTAALVAPSLPDAVARAGTPDDVIPLQAAMQASGEYPDDLVQMRLRDRRRPYIVAADSKIVSYGWVAFSAEPIGDLGLAFQIGPGEAYIYDCATRPDYRGRGYYTALLRLICLDLQRQGRTRAWIGTAPGNFVSQRGIARAGFMKVADVNLTRRPDGSFMVDLYGVPGVPPDLLAAAAEAFHARAHPDTGIPQASG